MFGRRRSLPLELAGDSLNQAPSRDLEAELQAELEEEARFEDEERGAKV